MMTNALRFSTALTLGLAALSSSAALAETIKFRSFSASAAMGPPAAAFADKLEAITQATLGSGNDVHFQPLAGLPAIPTQFAGDIMAAVAAGEAAGGFDAAYISGGDLNKTWGFIYNSGVPFGPTFDEFIGFLFGKSVDDGTRTGLDLMQSLLDASGKNIIAVPIVGGSEQLSGYFREPIEDVDGHRGIGLPGLCEKQWTLRYLPPAENVLNIACDDMVQSGKIRRKNLAFIQAVPGGGSLMDAVAAGTINGFEFATPVDDVSQVFNTPNNPGTRGLRFVHAPGWQQQFLLTWMIINKGVWTKMTAAQQVLIQTVARDHVLSSYSENMRQQGAALKTILEANKHDGDPSNDMVLSSWGIRDQVKLRNATIKFLNARVNDAALPPADRRDYQTIIEALRGYIHSNDKYWDHREVKTQIRFEDWANQLGQCWEAKCEPRSW